VSERGRMIVIGLKKEEKKSGVAAMQQQEQHGQYQ
jgi:hypothetical protein